MYLLAPGHGELLLQLRQLQPARLKVLDVGLPFESTKPNQRPIRDQQIRIQSCYKFIMKNGTEKSNRKKIG